MSEELRHDEVAAIVAHMNDDHADAVLVIARAFDADAEAEGGARMSGIDRRGIDIVRGEGRDVSSLRVPFPEPLRDARDARRALIALTRAARSRLGDGGKA